MTAAFAVRQPHFCGPLDLLVHLVRRREVDVLELTLAEVAAAYLEFLDVLQVLDLDAAGEFLLLAATLLEIKSQRLLPAEPDAQRLGADDAAAPPAAFGGREELLRQIEAYKQFKAGAERLRQAGAAQQRKLARLADDLADGPAAGGPPAVRDLELWDLVAAFGRMLKAHLAPATETVPADDTPLAERQRELEELVLAAARAGRHDGLRLEELLGQGNPKPRLIGKFLALLELIKLQRVWVEVERDGAVRILPPRGESAPLGPSFALLPDPTPADGDVALAMEDDTPPPDAMPRPPTPDAVAMESDDPPTDVRLPGARGVPPKSSAWADFRPLVAAESLEGDGSDAEPASGWAGWDLDGEDSAE